MKSSPFQTIILVIFVVAFGIAIVAFSGILSSNTATTATTELSGEVVIWGVLPSEPMQLYVNDVNGGSNKYSLVYEEHDPATFYTDLITAIADGRQPDVVLASSEIISQFSDKLYTTPYAAYSERGFRDTNIDGAQIFLSAEGVQAFPLVVDPLVVYYNKDLLAARNFVVPPGTWEDLVKSVPFFVRRDAQNVITQSAIGLGGTSNITHYRDILSALFLQTGNTIMTVDMVTKQQRSTLAEGANQSVEGGRLPTAQALEFYTGFADPTNRSYSWNRSLQSDLQVFLAGKSAFYIGRASDLFAIQSQNPNLNFDVSLFFQPTAAVRPITFGSFIAAGVLKSAPNFPAAYDAVSQFATADAVDRLSKRLSVPPVRRDLLLVAQQNPYVSVFFRAATGAFAWPDPNAVATADIFRAMITSVTSGAANADTAIYDASRNLQSNTR